MRVGRVSGMDECDKDGRTDLDVACYPAASLRDASVKTKLDWNTIFDKERVVVVVVASDGERSVDH